MINASVLNPPKVEITEAICFHCGEPVHDTAIKSGDIHFCCLGCKTVYEIINEKGLCDYYSIEHTPGTTQNKTPRKDKFDVLNHSDVKLKFIHFSDTLHSHATFYLPQMHCSSCIWLLENLSRINSAIIKSQVNFIKKEITIIFSHQHTDLKTIAENLSLIGYEPHISLNDIDGKKIKSYDYTQIIKLGVAGFCFGNIMMLSFPEYFSIAEEGGHTLKTFFSYLNLLLALPVFFYCASEFFVSGYKGLKQKVLNIDAPIALAILITFTRSAYEIITQTGAGYLDSMSGIVFFMLIGRFIQNRTYKTISFDRDFKSYFPLGITVVSNDTETQKPVSEVKIGDVIKIHNDEIIPADGILLYGHGEIDYSFVTGESNIVEKNISEIIYAGGKQTGSAIQLKVVKEATQSYLTQLWNTNTFKQTEKENYKSFIHKLSKHFTIILFSIALAVAVYWVINDPSKVWNAVTAILIVACPCALLLSATFTNGLFMRTLSKHGMYVKNEKVIETFAEINTIVFDKTGTITEQGESSVSYVGHELSPYQQRLIRSITYTSNHPLSKAMYKYLPVSLPIPVTEYAQNTGLGISGIIAGTKVKLGSSLFINSANTSSHDGSVVHIEINDEYLGYFKINNRYRTDLNKLISKLGKSYQLKLISGDNDLEKAHLETIFPDTTQLLFNQKPLDKLEYIKALQKNDGTVLMIGDGLNDAGALKQSDIGLAISDNNNNFSPACDAILQGTNFSLLSNLISFCKKQKTIINASFVVSLIYNVIGLTFAVQGTLQPVIAAILMPVSSLSIILITTCFTRLFEYRLLYDNYHKNH